MHTSGSRLCTLIGVPWRGVSFSTLSTGRFVLKQYICKGAESAEHAETAGYTYEGTPTTASYYIIWGLPNGVFPNVVFAEVP